MSPLKAYKLVIGLKVKKKFYYRQRIKRESKISPNCLRFASTTSFIHKTLS